MSGAPPGPPPPPAARRRGRAGCLLGILLASAAGLVLLFVGLLAALFFGGAPPVPEGSVVVVGSDGEYPETLPFAPFFFVDAGPRFSDLTAGVSRAAEDPRVAGLHLRIGATKLGWARARELRDGILRFREAGKRVTASLEYAGLMDYYLASAADRIHLHPRGQLGLFGISMEVMFYGDLLEKLGVEAQFEAVGRYKTAPEVFTGSGMSAAYREQLESLGADFREAVAAEIAAGRGLSPEEADRLLSDGPHTAPQALDRGLVDALGYQDEIRDDLGTDALIEFPDYLASLRGEREEIEARVAVVHVDGTILPGRSRQDVTVGRVAGAETVVQALDWAREEPSVDAVVLRVSSPGGSDSASDSIWRAAERVRAAKPVVASFGDTAASGGYWVSTGARRVVAAPLSVTGSIGVWVGKFSIAGLLEKVGIGVEVVSLGGKPNWTSPARPFEDSELDRLREGAAETYEVFLERVAAARGMTPAEVDAVGQGRVFTGRQALEAGLVDRLGGLGDAVRLAAVEAGFPEDAAIETIPLPAPPSLAEVLDAEFVSGGLRGRLSFLAAALRGVRWALLPFPPQFL